jgi:ribosome-binding protein aMBF1 (putative translation factor)
MSSPGREEDVHPPVQQERRLRTADNTNQQTMQRLARAFLVTSAVVRQAERVTAEEVHKVAQELEEVLGAVYSEQVVTFQMPYVGASCAT